MREYRGKILLANKKLGDWIYGNLIINDGHPFIVGEVVDVDSDHIMFEWWTPVAPETVGQFTGEYYKDKTRIYAGDLVGIVSGSFQDRGKEEKVLYNYVVKFENGGFVFSSDVPEKLQIPKPYGIPTVRPLSDIHQDFLTIEHLGNIHDK